MTYQEILIHLMAKTLVLPLVNDGLTQDLIKQQVSELAYAMSLADVSEDTIKTFSLIIDKSLLLHIHGPASADTMKILTQYAGIRQGLINLP